MYFFLSIVGLSCLLLLALFSFRHHLIALLPTHLQDRLNSASSNSYMRLPLFNSQPAPSTFESQLQAGFSSAAFDLGGNIGGGDERSGMDERGIEEVRAIMREMRCNFDQARLIRHKRILIQNGIDPNTGMPLDRKAITSLS